MSYRQEMLRTANIGQAYKDMLVNAGLGLTGEAGEVADLIKKHVCQGRELDREKLILELGDVRWYLELAAHLLNVPMAEIEAKNVEKLRKRYPYGFSTEASQNRKE